MLEVLPQYKGYQPWRYIITGAKLNRKDEQCVAALQRFALGAIGRDALLKLFLAKGMFVWGQPAQLPTTA